MNKYGSSRWGGNRLVDDVALLLNNDGKECCECERITRNEYLFEGLCPDCYKKNHGRKSPALTTSQRSTGGYCASGEVGEAE